MQCDAVDIEGNMAALKKIKITTKNDDKKKQKEETLPKPHLQILKMRR